MVRTRKWTQEEVDFLEQNYKKLPLPQLAKRINRTEIATAFKLAKDVFETVHKNRNFFTKEEEQFLKENYQDLSTKELANKLGRSANTINHKAMKLGLRKVRRPYKKYWTSAEDEYLKRNYSLQTQQELSEQLERSKNAIQLRAMYLGVRKRPELTNPTKQTQIRVEPKVRTSVLDALNSIYGI